MPTQIQLRRGTTSEHSSFTGAAGEVTVDTTKKTLVVHDGSTAGGIPVAKENNATLTGSVTLPGTSVFNSTGLGIGTSSPAQKLDVLGSIAVRASTSGANQDVIALRALNSDNSAYANAIYYGNSQRWAYAGATEGMRLDSSGNLGLGVTPSAWSGKAIEVGNKGTAIWNINQQNSSFTCNAYYDGAYKYGGTGLASVYQQAAGIHYWYTAASGTAGNAISFTQAMTLDASGNLLVGTPSSDGSRLRVYGSYQTLGDGAYEGLIGKASSLVSGGGSGDFAIRSAANLVFATNGNTERARISSNGGLQVGTSSGSGSKLIVYDNRSTSSDGTEAAVWVRQDGTNAIQAWLGSGGTERARITSAGEFWVANTTDQGAYNIQCGGTGVWGAGAYVNGSDRNLKNNIQSLDSCLDVVMAMRPVTFQYKPEHSKDQSVQPGFIAQELQEAMAGKAYIDGVVQSGPEYLNVAYQNIIPILVKAIQELKAEVAALKGA